MISLVHDLLPSYCRCFDSFVLADINCSSTDVEAHAELCTRMNSTIDPAVEFWKLVHNLITHKQSHNMHIDS